jgi:hypothetical protein
MESRQVMDIKSAWDLGSQTQHIFSQGKMAMLMIQLTSLTNNNNNSKEKTCANFPLSPLLYFCCWPSGRRDPKKCIITRLAGPFFPARDPVVKIIHFPVQTTITSRPFFNRTIGTQRLKYMCLYMNIQHL